MRPPMLLILTAVMTEARAVAKALGVPCPKPLRPTHATRYDISIELHVIGIRGFGLAHLRVKSPPNVILIAGLGGALDPQLKVADAVIEGLPSGWKCPANCRVGAIHSADQLVSTPSEKAALFARTSALAVEMENARVRDWIARQEWDAGQGVAVIGIRAISDRADQMLDPVMMGLVDTWGRARTWLLCRALVRRPSLIPQLIRLGTDSSQAAARLGGAVRALASEFARQTKQSANATESSATRLPD